MEGGGAKEVEPLCYSDGPARKHQMGVGLITLLGWLFTQGSFFARHFF